MSEKGKRVKYKLPHKNSHRNVKYSLGNVVNNTETIYSVTGVLDLLEWSHYKVYEWLSTVVYLKLV